MVLNDDHHPTLDIELKITAVKRNRFDINIPLKTLKISKEHALWLLTSTCAYGS